MRRKKNSRWPGKLGAVWGNEEIAAYGGWYVRCEKYGDGGLIIGDREVFLDSQRLCEGNSPGDEERNCGGGGDNFRRL